MSRDKLFLVMGGDDWPVIHQVKGGEVELIGCLLARRCSSEDPRGLTRIPEPNKDSCTPV